MPTDQSAGGDHSYHSSEQARRIFREALERGGFMSRKHARMRQKERNITNNDFLLLARIGIIMSHPELDIRTNEWKYTITTDDKSLQAVFTILDERRVRLITAIKDKERRGEQ